MHIENIHDAKAHLSRLIKRALAGDEVIIARAGEPLVRLVPVHFSREPRPSGQLKGQIYLASNFDDFDAAVERLLLGDEP